MIKDLGKYEKIVLKGASVAMLLRVAGMFLSLGLSIYFARVLQEDKLGFYYLCISVLTIATIFGRAGLDNAILRFTAAFKTNSDWNALGGFYTKSISIAVVASFLSAIALFFGSDLIAEYVFSKPAMGTYLKLTAIAVVPYSLTFLNHEALRGLKRIAASQIVTIILIPLITITGFYLLDQAEVEMALYAYATACIVCAILGFTLLYSSWKGKLKLHFNFPLEKILNTSGPLFWIALINYVTGSAALFILGIFEPEGEVGIFGIASRVARLSSFVIIAANVILGPVFSELYTHQEIEKLRKIISTSILALIGIAFPLLILIAIFPNQIMGIFGDGFKGGSMELIILSVGQFINLATGSVGILLMMTGGERLLRNNVMITGILMLVLCFSLIPIYGKTGAAIATATSLAFLNIHSVVLVKKHLGFNPLPFFK